MKPLFFAAMLTGIHHFSTGQPGNEPLKPFTSPYSKIIDWYSPVVQDSFRIYVYTPDEYHDETKKFPVLYLTDGDWSFTNAVIALSNLRQDYFMQEPIVIAIGYGTRTNQRQRDLDPSHGASAFLQSVRDEIIPWVNRRFRTNGQQALYGYSLGGKFATHALFAEPELFSSVMIGAPADHGVHLMPEASRYRGRMSDLPSRIFLATGEYERETVINIGKFKKWCEEQKLTVTTAVIPGANHGAAISAVLQEALRQNFAQLRKEITLSGRQLQKYARHYQNDSTGEAYQLFVKNDSLKVMLHGYGTDLPYTLHATSPDTFFLIENQRLLYDFSAPGTLTIILPDGKRVTLKKRK